MWNTLKENIVARNESHEYIKETKKDVHGIDVEYDRSTLALFESDDVEMLDEGLGDKIKGAKKAIRKKRISGLLATIDKLSKAKAEYVKWFDGLSGDEKKKMIPGTRNDKVSGYNDDIASAKKKMGMLNSIKEDAEVDEYFNGDSLLEEYLFGLHESDTMDDLDDEFDEDILEDAEFIDMTKQMSDAHVDAGVYGPGMGMGYGSRGGQSQHRAGFTTQTQDMEQYDLDQDDEFEEDDVITEAINTIKMVDGKPKWAPMKKLPDTHFYTMHNKDPFEDSIDVNTGKVFDLVKNKNLTKMVKDTDHKLVVGMVDGIYGCHYGMMNGALVTNITNDKELKYAKGLYAKEFTKK